MAMNNKAKVSVGLLTVSAAFFTALIKHEGFRSAPYRDQVGVPTIGIGSTQYPDGSKVSMQDKPVTQAQAVEISRAHISKDEAAFRASLPGVKLSQAEYDLYLDFVYQYGRTAWSKSSMRRQLLAGQHKAACQSLLKYRFAGGRDCSIRKNGCYGVWTRQQERHRKCMEANT